MFPNGSFNEKIYVDPWWELVGTYVWFHTKFIV